MTTNTFDSSLRDCGTSAPVSLSRGGLFVFSMQEQTILKFDQPNKPERWLPIAGYEGLYEVSDLGNVRSTGHVPGRWGKMPAKVMAKTISGKRYKIPGQGYYQVHLTKDGVGKLLRVCRLVAIAFIPNPTNLPQVNHIDGNPRRDVVSNLEWTTNQGNQLHAVRTGLHNPVYGELQPTHVLTADEVTELRSLNKTQRQLAREFGISKTQVGRIQRNESWKHLLS